MLAMVAGSTGVALAGCSERDGQPTETSTTATPELSLSAPSRTPRDEAFDLVVEGAPPGATVTLEATMVDSDSDPWSSKTTWEADDDGRVAVADSEPVSGAYEDTSTMGWLWSMTPESKEESFSHSVSADEKAVSLTAATDVGRVETDVTLELNDPGISDSPIQSDDFVGGIAEPAGDGPHPAVLVLHGSVPAVPRRLMQLLASHGYAALGVRYFGDGDPVPDALSRVPLSYFDRAQRWLRDREFVQDAPVGVIGASRGGELALLLGARFDWVGAAVSYVGSGVGWGAARDTTAPAWEDDGEPVPFLQVEGSWRLTEDGEYRRTTPTFEAGLDAVDASTLEEATFAVENGDCPVLAISGGDDQIWPSTRLSEIAMARLREHDFEYDFEHASYEAAGHAISRPFRPTTNRAGADPDGMPPLAFGGTPEGYATADADSWPKVRSYLEKGLVER
ncbi:acyl-CoA thioesterase/bile acid-CoA:amino acid N-acyltransferase family protein [Halorubellus sp. PRR65]|uniref:acyl-CoA thioesterase/bile acid-CoA:amino acid N-acyltransferase family protein n=1 Tax=Halorubellus sp. PRR65 TaxID=3098148 RepID=UPI002B25AE68|nr:acyl-CoA thioesterase/bile acid-CoA:amino acid N-acyltransferase family protein [Halorubellus sp. PRR65]